MSKKKERGTANAKGQAIRVASVWRFVNEAALLAT